MLVVWDWRVRDDLRDRRAVWRAAARYAPYGAVLALYWGLRSLALRDAADTAAAGAWAPPITRLLTTLQTVATYAWITIVPYPANAYRVIVPATVPPDLHWWLAMVGLGAALAGTAWALWRVPVVGFGALWFWITLAPSAGVNLLPLPTVLMAERFLYLPTVGYCLILGWLASRLLGPVTLGRAAQLRPAPTLGLVVLLLAYFVLTLWRNEDWRDEDRLYSAMAEASPASAVPHVNLAFVQLPRGEIASANEHLREAVRLAPGNPRAQAGLGLTETLLGHLDAGLRHGLRARELAPDNPDVLASLGALYLARGEPARAAPELRTSLRRQAEPGARGAEPGPRAGLARPAGGGGSPARARARAGAGDEPGPAAGGPHHRGGRGGPGRGARPRRVGTLRRAPAGGRPAQPRARRRSRSRGAAARQDLGGLPRAGGHSVRSLSRSVASRPFGGAVC